MKIALIKQIFSDFFSNTIIEQNVIRNNNCCSSSTLQAPVNMLHEVKLLITGLEC